MVSSVHLPDQATDLLYHERILQMKNSRTKMLPVWYDVAVPPPETEGIEQPGVVSLIDTFPCFVNTV